MATATGPGTTVVLRKKHLSTEAGAGLLKLLTEITADGKLTLEEVKTLDVWLKSNLASPDVPAVTWLQDAVTDALVDGKLSAAERTGLMLALERVLPKEERSAAKAAPHS
jgi:hypothetical protein